MPNIIGRADTTGRVGQARRRRGSGLRPGRRHRTAIRARPSSSRRSTGGATPRTWSTKTQGHEADQQLAAAGGRQHPPRHRRGAVHDRSDRLSRAHPAKGDGGNDLFPEALSEAHRAVAIEHVRRLGDRLHEGQGLSSRPMCSPSSTPIRSTSGSSTRVISGASSMTNVTCRAYADIPLFLFHLLEFMDVDYEVDVDEINERWRDLAAVDVRAQLIMKEPVDSVERPPGAHPDRHLEDDGSLRFVGVTNDWHDVTHEDECFFLRVYGPGDYRFKGADLGVLVTKGHADRRRPDRALPALHRRHPVEVQRKAAGDTDSGTDRVRQVGTGRGDQHRYRARAPDPPRCRWARRPVHGGIPTTGSTGQGGRRRRRRGSCRPDGWGPVASARTSSLPRPCGWRGQQRPSGRGCRGSRCRRTVRTNQNWLRYQPPAGPVPSRRRRTHRGCPRRCAGPAAASFRAPRSMSDPAVVEQHLAGTAPGREPSADSTVGNRGPEPVTGDLGVNCAHRAPDEGGHEVGHPHAGGPLAHPAENVGIRRTVDELAAVRPLRGQRGEIGVQADALALAPGTPSHVAPRWRAPALGSSYAR